MGMFNAHVWQVMRLFNNVRVHCKQFPDPKNVNNYIKTHPTFKRNPKMSKLYSKSI